MARASHINFMGYCFQVAWANARWRFAKMVKFCSFRYWPIFEHVRKTMCCHGTPVNTDLPIAELRRSSCPQPTCLCLIDSLPKTFGRSIFKPHSPCKGISMSQVASEMFSAIAMGFTRIFAAFYRTRASLYFVGSSRDILLRTSSASLPTVMKATQPLCVVRFLTRSKRTICHNNFSIAHGVAR